MYRALIIFVLRNSFSRLLSINVELSFVEANDIVIIIAMRIKVIMVIMVGKYCMRIFSKRRLRGKSIMHYLSDTLS